MILTHYFQQLHSNQYFSKQELFTTITEYSSHEQKYISTNLSHCTGRAYRRFKLFDDYIQKRNETEKWLYSTFLCAGGKPITSHPFYFILGKSEQLKADFGMDANELILDTDHIDTSMISFTLGDSVGIYFSQAQKRLYSFEDVKTISLDPNFVQEQMMLLQPYHRYIEAQLWDKHYLEKAVIMTDYPLSLIVIIPYVSKYYNIFPIRKTEAYISAFLHKLSHILVSAANF